MIDVRMIDVPLYMYLHVLYVYNLNFVIIIIIVTVYRSPKKGVWVIHSRPVTKMDDRLYIKYGTIVMMWMSMNHCKPS